MRIGHDIVIPQFNKFVKYSTFKNISTRKVFSMFNGKITHSLFFDGHFTRVKLYNLSNAYKNIYPRLLSVNSKKIKVIDSYFSYAPTGKAPWSSRIWEAVLSLSIPVILVDSIVEPFEKWLNYMVTLVTSFYYNP